MTTHWRTSSRRCPAWRWPVLLGLWLAVMGCGHYEPFEPPQIQEIPEGRGLFTGAAGEVILFSDGKLLPREEKKTADTSNQAAEDGADASTKQQ